MMKLSFKQKMIGQMLAVGLLPLLAVTGYNAYRSYHQIVHSTEIEFAAVRDMVNERTEDYFEVVDANLNTLANDTNVADLIVAMGKAISNDDILQDGFHDLAYQERFDYQKQNTPGATDADAKSWMQTDPKLRTLQDIFISSNPEKIGEKNKLYEAKGSSEYVRLHNANHARFNEYVKGFGYYDVFLIDAATQRVVYTVFKEIDFMASIKEGYLADTGLARVARKALASTDPTQYFMEDFSVYAPSYNAQAMFAASPVVVDGKTVGAVVFQLPPERIQGMFSGISTLGDTAEGFFFGEDYTLRSDAVNKDNAAMKIGTPIPERVVPHLEPVWKGEPLNVTYTGVQDKTMMAALRTVTVKGITWAMLLRVDYDEMLKPVYSMLWITGASLLLVTLIVSVVGYLLAEVTVRPIMRLAHSFATSAEKVARANNEVGEAVSSMVAASEETSAQTVVIRRNSTEASGYVSSVSTSIEELNISINDISQSIGETNMVIDDAVHKAARTDEVVRKLGQSAQKITEVVSLINTLAEQTNLLALNAAIEAARAGDAGRGFAVVADEVKKLASNTSNATVEIGEQVKEIRDVAEQSISALHGVVQAIHKIRDNATTVSAAVEEQSGTAKTIAGSVRDAAGRVQQVDDNMTGIEQAAHDTGVASDQVNSASNEVSTAFNTLKTEVGQVLDDMGIRR